MWISDMHMSSLGCLWIFLLEPCTLCKSSFFAPGTKEDCDKEALNLSFSSSPSHLPLSDDYDSNSGKYHSKVGIIFFKVAQPSVFVQCRCTFHLVM